MAELKVVINDPKTGKTYQKAVDASLFNGRKLGETVQGAVFGLPGFSVKIMGGSDNAGFPMRKEIDGFARKRPLLSKGPGVHIKRKGMLIRKLVRGNTFNEFSAQANVMITEHGKENLDELLPKQEKKDKKK